MKLLRKKSSRTYSEKAIGKVTFLVIQEGCRDNKRPDKETNKGPKTIWRAQKEPIGQPHKGLIGGISLEFVFFLNFVNVGRWVAAKPLFL